MKRLLVLLLTVLTVFGVCGCIENYGTSSQAPLASKNEKPTVSLNAQTTVQDPSSDVETEIENKSTGEEAKTQETVSENNSTQQTQSNQSDNSSTQATSSKQQITSSKQQTTSSKQQTTSSKQITSSKQKTTSSVNHPKTTGDTVYCTPTGKRYHRDIDCGGKNSSPININDAIKRGLTPCKKCAQ